MDQDPTRLSIEIDPALHHRLRQVIPYGLRSKIIRNLVEMAVDLVETGKENGSEHMALGLLMSDQIGLCPKEAVNNVDTHEKD